jgi:hypothetical protein
MSKLWDTFMIKDELDMMYCHLVEYDEVVDRFIVCEASQTHQGEPKPLFVRENWERFAPWHDRITLLCADEVMPSVQDNPDPWSRELAQRDYMMRGLDGSEAEDRVIVADVDELLSPAALKAEPGPEIGFNIQLLFCAVDWMGTPGVMPTMARRGSLWSLNGIRERREHLPRFVPEGAAFEDWQGWHLSWLGGPDAIRRKANAFCHIGTNNTIRDGVLAIANEMYELGWSEPGKGARPVDIDSRWPKWVVESWDFDTNTRKPEGPAPAIWFRPRYPVGQEPAGYGNWQ